MPELNGTNSNTRWLALIGGSVRAAAADAKLAGYRLIAIDRFGDRDLLDVCDHWIPYDDQEKWIDRLRELPFAPLVPVGGFRWPRTVHSDEEAYRLIDDRLITGPRLSTLQALNCPVRLSRIARDCGVLFPKSHSLDHEKLALGDASSFSSKLREQMKCNQWLLKPRDHSGGVGIRRLDQMRPGDEATHYLQERLNGFPLGASFIAWKGATCRNVKFLGAFRGITYRHNADHPFLYGGSLGPIRLSPTTVQRLSELGEAIAGEFSLDGVFNIDLIMQADGTLALLEINPRYSASMELLARSICQAGLDCKNKSFDRTSLVEWHLAAHENVGRLGTKVEHWLATNLDSPVDLYSCKRIVYGRVSRPCVEWNRLEKSLNAIRKLSLTHLEIEVCYLPCSSAGIMPGGPLCTVIVRGAISLHEALRATKRLARQIENA